MGEILKFNKYDSKVDLWSAGTIIYQMLAAQPPFNGMNHIELLKKIETTKHLKFPSGLSEECKDLILGLLKRNPTQRISWNAFFSHPWLRQRKNDFDGMMMMRTSAKKRMDIGEAKEDKDQIQKYMSAVDVALEAIQKL